MRQDGMWCPPHLNGFGGSFPGDKAVWGVKLTTHLHLVHWLKISGVAIPSRYAQGQFYLYLNSEYPLLRNSAVHYYRPHWIDCGSGQCHVYTREVYTSPDKDHTAAAVWSYLACDDTHRKRSRPQRYGLIWLVAILTGNVQGPTYMHAVHSVFY
jgi:hypothetical protein